MQNLLPPRLGFVALSGFLFVFGSVAATAQEVVRDLVPMPQGLRLPEPRPQSIVGADDRVRVVDTTQWPYRTIVHLSIRFPGGMRGCTGALIWRFHVLTAGHCVFDRSLGGFAKSIEVTPARDDLRRPFGVANATFLRTFSPWTDREDFSYDQALLTLDRPLGAALGAMPIFYSFDGGVYRRRFETAGYPQFRFETMWYGSGLGHVPDGMIMQVDFDGEAGQSGSPLWFTDSDGIQKIAAVYSYDSGDFGQNFTIRFDPERIRSFERWRLEDAVEPRALPLLIADAVRVRPEQTPTRPAQTIFVEVDVGNGGEAAAPPFPVKFQLVNVDTNVVTDLPLGIRWTLSDLPAAQRRVMQRDFDLPRVSPGTYVVRVELDYDNGTMHGEVEEHYQPFETHKRESNSFVISEVVTPQLSVPRVEGNLIVGLESRWTVTSTGGFPPFYYRFRAYSISRDEWIELTGWRPDFGSEDFGVGSLNWIPPYEGPWRIEASVRTNDSLTAQAVSVSPEFLAKRPTGGLWWQHADGRLALWSMSRESLLDGRIVGPGKVPDPQWRLAASGDFDRDGSADLIFQHSDGRLMAWFLVDGTHLLLESPLIPAQVPDIHWKVRAAADFDSDGWTDLVWQHTTTGEVAMWLMTGRQVREGRILTPIVTDLNWEIVGAGDTNSDGNPDLLWQHKGTGYLAIWTLRGTQLIAGELMSPSQVSDLDWKVSAVTDLNNDGYVDLIWRNRANGMMSVWFMLGATLADGVRLNPFIVGDTGWQIRAAR